MTSQQCNTNAYCMVVLHACIHEPLVWSQPKPKIVRSATKRPGSTEYGKPKKSHWPRSITLTSFAFRRHTSMTTSPTASQSQGGLSRLHSADEDAVLWLTSYGSWNAYEKKWGAFFTDLQFQILGANDRYSFENVFQDHRLDTKLRFVAKFGEDWLLRHCRKVVWITTQKNSGSVKPPFCPKWADRAQNSLNVVTCWPVHIYWIWSRSAPLCQTYCGKIYFSDPRSKYNIGF